MITGNTYRYFLIFITIFAFYQLIFFYLLRPYYLKHIAGLDTKVKVPEVAFEVLYLLILVLGLAVSPIVEISPYLLWAIIFSIYSLAIRYSKTSFFLASALIIKIHRELPPQKQLEYQGNLIFVICLLSAVVFLITGYFLKPFG